MEQKYIYHYTSLENAMNIIKPEGLIFWGSRYDCMNDPFDSIYSRDILLKMFHLKEGIEDNLKAGIFYKENAKNFINYIPYFVSFSKNRDDALMWRLYNAQVCMKILKYKVTSKYNDDYMDRLQCKECCYLSPKQIKREYAEKFSNMPDKKDIWKTIMIDSTFIKHPDFRCENEVRVVDFNARLCVNDAKLYDDEKGEIPNNFKYKKVLNSTKIVYYKEFQFDKDALCGIIVNTNNKDEFIDIKEHLEIWLHKCGGYHVYPNFIQKSKRVPVRRN